MIRKTLHYIKHSLILRNELTLKDRRKFRKLGSKVMIEKPVKLHSGLATVEIGDNTTILKYSRIQTYPNSVFNENNGTIYIGENCYIGFNLTLLSGPDASINIGNNVLIASNVIITNINHGTDPEDHIEYMDQKLVTQSVSIEDGCWVGENVCILPGVTIGKKSIVGAASVVTRSIPPYSIAVGNPARIIKKYNFESHFWEKI